MGHAGLGIVPAEDRDVVGHDARRDGGEAAGHQGGQLGSSHAGDIGFDEQRGFGLAEEDVGGAGEAFGSAQPHRFGHHPGETGHHALEDAVVVAYGRERGGR